MSELLLKISGINKSFFGVQVLRDVGFELRLAAVLGLVGENGSGKSTLIKLVSGVHGPDPGTLIEVDGIAHARITPALAKSLGVQVIYQDLSLFPNLSVAENIAIDCVLGGFARPVRRRKMRSRTRCRRSSPDSARARASTCSRRRRRWTTRGTSCTAVSRAPSEPHRSRN